MAFKRTTLFPDYIYEGQIEIPDTLKGGIKESIDLNKQSGITTELVYGWNTNKQFPMEGVMPNLVNLMATYFVDSVLGSNDLKNRDINLLNPYLISTFPTHQYPTTIEPQRWYNAGMFIQTTNKGSHLSFQNYGNKLYAGQNTQENITYVKPKQFKVVFWPSHIPWSLTPNMSMVETTMLVCTFRADARKK
tara:strand:+ start:1474 stop:2046 length:573 start_codon:yes stop_codon:yes gene_type:complete